MQSQTSDFVPGAATSRSRPNNVFWRPTGAATWRTERNIRVMFDCLFPPLHENVTSSTKPEVHNISHCRQRMCDGLRVKRRFLLFLFLYSLLPSTTAVVFFLTLYRWGKLWMATFLSIAMPLKTQQWFGFPMIIGFVFRYFSLIIPCNRLKRSFGHSAHVCRPCVAMPICTG